MLLLVVKLPWTQCYKPNLHLQFTNVCKKVAFVPGKPFQPRLMVVGKPRSLSLHLGRAWPYLQLLILERLNRYKHCNLFRTFINY
jgi:hypothetical protein